MWVNVGNEDSSVTEALIRAVEIYGFELNLKLRVLISYYLSYMPKNQWWLMKKKFILKIVFGCAAAHLCSGAVY